MNSNWICRLAAWLRWGSLIELMAVIAILLPLPVVAQRSEEAGDAMLTVVQVGFALMVITFMASIGCQVAGPRIGRRAGSGR